MAVDTRQRLRGRREARFHVQLEIARTLPGARHDELIAEGRVVRVFRGDDQLRVGQAVELVVPVFRPGELVAPGKAHLPHEAIAGAAFLEAYLDGDPPRCSITLDEVAVIPAPSSEPVLTPAELEAVLARGEGGRSSARRWWRFWRRGDGR